MAASVGFPAQRRARIRQSAKLAEPEGGSFDSSNEIVDGASGAGGGWPAASERLFRTDREIFSGRQTKTNP